MPIESKANKIIRAKKIIAKLKKLYPDAHCALNFKTVHQLMVATILSAQCTDERVNIVTKDLFKKYKSIEDFAAADLKELGQDVYSSGFYSAKAKSIKHSAQRLLAVFGGKIPKTLQELTTLAGVGRKTGSVVLGVGFNMAEGIVVDTHVGRICRLLKLTSNKDAVKIENDLIKIIEEKDWILFSHLMIYHGRAVCIARRPACQDCGLKTLCPSSTV